MAARVEVGSSKPLFGTALSVGVDLGRHRSYAGSAAHSFGHPIPLSNQHDGLLIRWVGDGEPQRVTERILALAGTDQEAAIGFVSLVARQLISGLPSTIPDTPEESKLSITRVAIPATFGPECRRAVLEGFRRSGALLDAADLVERPIAALAGWMAHREQISGRAPRDPVLLIDNDGGELSAVVADPLTRRLLACMPLSTGPNDDPTLVVERLRELITTAAGMMHREGIIQATDWPSISSTIPQAVVTGSGHDHPAVGSLIKSLLPAADVMPDPVIANPASCVVLGLQHLDVFTSWRACWPTTDIRIGDAIVVEQGQALTRVDEPYVVTPNAELLFGFPDRNLNLVAGSVRASALVVPPSIGPLPLLKLMHDGRMQISGAKGIRPLTVQVSWPCPGTSANEMRIATVGRRAATLV